METSFTLDLMYKIKAYVLLNMVTRKLFSEIWKVSMPGVLNVHFVHRNFFIKFNWHKVKILTIYTS